MESNTLPKGWQMTTLENIAQKSGYGFVDGPFGSNLPASEYVSFGVPVIRGANLSLGECRFKDHDFVFVSEETAQRLKRSLCSYDDIVFTKKGTLGQVGIVPSGHRYRKFLLSSNQIKLSVDREQAEPSFVYYYVSSPASREKIVRDSEATGVPKTNLTYLRGFPISLPPLAEQRAIARILGALDDKIELNRQTNQTLEAMASALFKSWFVDFDPVRALEEGRQPAYMDEATARLFPHEFEDSVLGEIPKGWRVAKVDELCLSIENGGTPKRQEGSYWDNGSIPWFKTGELTDGALIDSEEKITELGLSKSSCKVWNPTTILIALYASPTVGRLGILEVEAAANQACSALVVRPEYGYLFLFYSLMHARPRLQQIAVGAAQQNINQKVLREHKIIAPPPEIALAFHSKACSLYNLEVSKVKESQTLANIRDTLLPKLMSGEIRVKEAEKQIEINN